MNMKYYKLYIIPVLVAAVASCTKAGGPEGGVSPEGRAVSISVGVDSPEGGASGVEAAVAGLPATRAEGSTPYSGSTLGLFLDYGKDSFGDPVGGTTKSNVLWSNDGSNNWTTKGQMLWGKSSDKVGVYAYAPYLEGQEDASGVVFTIPTDQSEGLEAADLLWWYKGIEEGKKADVAAKDFKDGKIDIAFRHALIKLTVNFTLASQFEGQNISIKEAWFHRSMDKVKIDFTGSDNNSIPYVGMSSTTSSNATSIKMHNCSSEGKLSCEVLFFPHSLTKDLKLLTVTLSDGRDYILTLDKDLGLWERTTGGYVTGVAYEMAVTVGKTKLEGGGVITVSPWTEKDSLGDDFGTDATEYSEWDGAEIATAYAGGDGSEGSPYEIATAAQLAFFAHEANKNDSEYQWAETRKYFKLTANINLKGHEWTPIGSESLRFAGSFDGDGHVIVNLNVKGAGRFAGLFGWMRNGATVKNLVIRNASVSAVAPDSETKNPEAYSGIVAAYCAAGCTISNCKVDGTVTSDYCAGGIVGYSDNSSKDYDGSITLCTADVICSVAGSTKASYCGGIAGYSCVKMYGCTVRGKIDGPCDVGGLVGWLGTGGSLVYHFSYVYAEVGISKVELTNLSPSIGGLVGSASSGSKISDCYMKGKVSCADGLALDDVHSFYIGGIVGSAQNVELAGCHYRGSISVGKPANGKLYTGFFIGELMSGVKATNNNSYMIDGAAGLPVYGYKKDGVDDSEIYIEAIE